MAKNWLNDSKLAKNGLKIDLKLKPFFTAINF